MDPSPPAKIPIPSHKLLQLSSVTPSEGELFNRFSPELQKYNLENRERRRREYEDFVGKLKEYSKSDKPSMSSSDFISAAHTPLHQPIPMHIYSMPLHDITESWQDGSFRIRARSFTKDNTDQPCFHM